MAKLLTVALKAMVLVVSRGTKERAILEEDLCQMACHGLMERPWCLKYKKIAAELLASRDNQWNGTVRQDLEMWTAASWCKVYDFPIHGEGMATQGEKLVEGKFTHLPHLKDGYSLLDCKDPGARRVLEFLILIHYLEKPTRITITFGNTIFGAYTGERVVDWALVIMDTVRRLLAEIGKSKPTPICLYLLHLYYVQDAIQPEDKKVYMVGESFMGCNVKSDKEKQSADAEESDRKSLKLGEIAKL